MIRKYQFFYLFIMLVGLLLVNPWDAAGQSRRGGRPPRFQNILEHDLRPYHFGFTVGINFMTFNIQQKENMQSEYGFTYILPELDFGYHVGIVSNLKLGEFFDLRFIPTLAWADRYIEYYPTDFKAGFVENPEFEPFYLQLPLHIKYKSARMNNTRAYIISGFKYTYDFSSLEKSDIAGDEVFLTTFRNDINYELGVGFDYYFYYFKFSTEIKASFGIRNIVLPGDADPNNNIQNIQERHWEAINRLNSRTIMISFLFE